MYKSHGGLAGLLDGSASEAMCYALIATLMVGCAGIAPLLFIPLETGAALRNKDSKAAETLNKFLSFAVGALLGDVFLHLLPEAYAESDGSADSSIMIGLWVIAGLIIFMAIEMLLSEDETAVNSDDTCDQSTQENRGGKDSKNASESIAISGYLNLLANVVDNFTHGLAIGGSYQNSVRLGHLTTLAILLHEVPHEISDFAILLRAGFDRWGAAKAQVLTASGSIFGTMVGFHGGSIVGSASWILPFTSGGFLYIALVTVLPDLLNHEETLPSAIKKMLIIFLGVGSMCAVNVLHS